MKKQLEKQAQNNWLQRLFQGICVTRTICNQCGNKSEREEPFFDLSLDIQAGTSLVHSIRQLSKVEVLDGSDKFQCDNCQSLQKAQKKQKKKKLNVIINRLLIKTLPKNLIVHFKRFKYDENYKQMVKLTTKMPFPFELKISTVIYLYHPIKIKNYNEKTNKYYDLSAIVIHVGQGIVFGHYVAIIKIKGNWYLYDDDRIDPFPEQELFKFYGRDVGTNNLACAYLLFYTQKIRV